MIRMFLAAALIAGGATVAMAQGSGGGAAGAGGAGAGGAGAGAGGGAASGAGGGTGTMRRDDNRPAVAGSGHVVCSGNTCWHATERYDYPADARVTIHEPAWTAGPGITFREHPGRGYWRDDRWVEW
jgi:hypothetical protein